MDRPGYVSDLGSRCPMCFSKMIPLIALTAAREQPFSEALVALRILINPLQFENKQDRNGGMV
jgi:hypothetical protein